jgi:hypothetical protein
MIILTKQLSRILLIGFSLVCLGHLFSVLFFFNEAVRPIKGTHLIFDMFFFESEKNITALFSASLFAILSILFYTISKKDPLNKRYWYFFLGISIFLACDEWFCIHEQFNNIYTMPHNIPFWLIVYVPIVFIVFLSLIPFLKNIPTTLRYQLIVSGGVFISGAVIFEAANILFSNNHPLYYNAMLFFEDGLEMLGVLLAIFATISHLNNHGITHIQWRSWAFILIVFITISDLIITYNLAI